MARKYVHFLFRVLCILMLNEWLKRHNRCTRIIFHTSPLFFILPKIPINTEMDAAFFFFFCSFPSIKKKHFSTLLSVFSLCLKFSFKDNVPPQQKHKDAWFWLHTQPHPTDSSQNFQKEGKKILNWQIYIFWGDLASLLTMHTFSTFIFFFVVAGEKDGWEILNM